MRSLQTLVRALPHPPRDGQRRLRLAVLHAGAPAPGMNTAVRVAVRLALDQGHTMLGVRRGFQGLARRRHARDGLDERERLGARWAGAELGTDRDVPAGPDLLRDRQNHRGPPHRRPADRRRLGGLQGRPPPVEERANFPAFRIPIVCLPATIDNNLPGSELSIGADTALNNIVEAVDKIKQSAVADRRCFVVEVMGRDCGYLALMSGLATGAERVYLHEEGITLKSLKEDLDLLVEGFKGGKRLGLDHPKRAREPDLRHVLHVAALRRGERRRSSTVRESILGHLQQGGDPSPFDRIQATKLARRCVGYLIEQASEQHPAAAFIGMVAGKVRFHALEDLPRMMDEPNRRPKTQWWLGLRAIADALARSGPAAVERGPVTVEIDEEEEE